MTLPVNLVEERARNVTREPPAYLVERFTRIGGTVGGRALFRVIWGGNRWISASDGVTLIRPYRVDMWHLEKWHEGEYEHCYRLGECPVAGGHRKTAKEPWCKRCFLDGGVPLPIEGCSAFVEGLIRMILKTEEMQKQAVFNGKVNTEQRDALMQREARKEDRAAQAIGEASADAAPVTVKRSFETPMRLSAQQLFGRRKGIRQLNAREIARGLRKQRSK